jgi:hypothetical protein
MYEIYIGKRMIELYDFIVKISRGMIIKKTPIWSFFNYSDHNPMFLFLAAFSRSVNHIKK